MPNSLLYRIAAPFILLIILIVGGLSIYVTSYIRNVYIDNFSTKLESDALVIANQIAPFFLEPVNHSEIQKISKDNSSFMKSRITIVDISGNVISDSEVDPSLMENHANRKEIISGCKMPITS